MVINVPFRFKRAKAAKWASKNPTLKDGQPGYEKDTGLLKIGDGVRAWNVLPYIVTKGHTGTLMFPVSANMSVAPIDARIDDLLLNAGSTTYTIAGLSTAIGGLVRITSLSPFSGISAGNIRGVQGAKGDTGAQGIQGLKGDKGDTGAQGIQGLKGDKGDTGAQGAKGVSFYPWNTATAVTNISQIAGMLVGDFIINTHTATVTILGQSAAVGDVVKSTSATAGTKTGNIRGVQGAKGDTGAQGIQGLKGDKGDTGAQGIQGLKGDKGDTGAQGIQGTAGASGVTYDWLTGAGAAATALGKVGDMYLDTVAYNVYKKTGASVWTLQCCIRGIGTLYGECTTAAATAAKAVSIAGFSLVVGSRVAIKFTQANTAAAPTINISGTGAKEIHYKGARITNSPPTFLASVIYDLIYTGTVFEVVGNIAIGYGF